VCVCVLEGATASAQPSPRRWEHCSEVNAPSVPAVPLFPLVLTALHLCFFIHLPEWNTWCISPCKKDTAVSTKSLILQCSSPPHSCNVCHHLNNNIHINKFMVSYFSLLIGHEVLLLQI
jgi:hypothetical protein